MNQQQQQQLVNEHNLRNMRDYMVLYNNLTERCFSSCAVLQHDSRLSQEEKICVEKCTDRFKGYNQRLMPTFQQNYQARMKEAEKVALEQMEKAKKEQEAAAQTQEQTTPPSQTQGETIPPSKQQAHEILFSQTQNTADSPVTPVQPETVSDSNNS